MPISIRDEVLNFVDKFRPSATPRGFDKAQFASFYPLDTQEVESLIRLGEETLIGLGWPISSVEIGEHNQVHISLLSLHSQRDATYWRHHAIHDEHPRILTERGYQRLQDSNTVLVWPVVEDPTEQVNLCAFGRLRIKE